MKFLSLEAFVPSGKQFEASRQLFQELGFNIKWEAGGLVGFERDGGKFILQQYDNTAFAENLMLSVRVTDVKALRDLWIEKKLVERFGVRIGEIQQQPYGKEVNVIDIAGVCWHFVE